MVRTYGEAPFSVAVIHGGPGDLGALSSVARQLANITGVIEPIQSALTIDALVDELNDQLRSITSNPLTLIGHSWGAWLIMLYAARYPNAVKQIVLVGCGPLDERFVPEIQQRRIAKFSAAEKALFNRLLSEITQASDNEKNSIMDQLGALVEKSDNYCLDNQDRSADNKLQVDGKMYAAVWPQAAKMRSEGQLIEAARNIHCPIIIIHGKDDPHPIEGITQPLTARAIKFQCRLLPKCGHSPFKEKFAKQKFYQIIEHIITPNSDS